MKTLWSKAGNTHVHTDGREIKPALNNQGKQMGYHVYHRNPTRRIWIGFAPTIKEAKKVRNV